jgi:hypothetical protein
LPSSTQETPVSVSRPRRRQNPKSRPARKLNATATLAARAFPRGATPHAANSAAPKRATLKKRARFAGAPILACNHWLEEQMRRLPDPRRYHHLYRAWLDRYTTLRGYGPADPRRSFRSAAHGCLRRITGPKL